jgi:hypothetical protein
MKLSKHPIGTIINVEGYGKFEKVSMSTFKSLTKQNSFFTTPYLKRLRKQGTVITVIAAPWSVVVELLTMVMDEVGVRDDEGNFITFDTIYKDAIKRDTEFKRMRAAQERVVQNYCEADVKMTSAFFEKFFKGESDL